MRLTVIGPGHPFRGGIASTTTSLVQALRARNHDVRFVIPTRQYPRMIYPGGRDRDPESCPLLAETTACFAPLEPWTWAGARKLILSRRDDGWVLPYWTWAWAFWSRFLMSARRRPPVVGVVHNPSDHDSGMFRRMAARSVLSRCDGLMTHAEVLARQVRTDHPGLPVVSCPLPPAARPDRLPDRHQERARLGISDDSRLALFFGLIRPYKGVDVLLEAMSELPSESPWRLIVAGEPWNDMGRLLQEKVTQLGVQGRVELRLGWVPEAELEQLLAAADLVVLPYRSGTQSAVAPRALDRGVPILSTRVGGLGEVVQNGVNGYLVSPGIGRELTDALNSLADGDRLKELRDGARRVAAGMTWDAYAETLEKVLTDILNR